MVIVFSLDDIGKRDEREASDIGRVERTVVGGAISRKSYAVRKRGELRSPVTWALIMRCVAGTGAGNSYRGGLVGSVSDNFDAVGIQLVVGDGF